MAKSPRALLIKKQNRFPEQSTANATENSGRPAAVFLFGYRKRKLFTWRGRLVLENRIKFMYNHE